MRKGKYYRYRLELLEYLLENDFIIDLEEIYGGSLVIANKLNIPKSSWYDITNELHNEGLILMKFKKKWMVGGIINQATKIQLSKKGLEHLIRQRHA